MYVFIPARSKLPLTSVSLRSLGRSPARLETQPCIARQNCTLHGTVLPQDGELLQCDVDFLAALSYDLMLWVRRHGLSPLALESTPSGEG